MSLAGTALFAEILAARDDDGPRLVWADDHGGERGELVVLQCELARGDRTPAAAAALRRRQRELLLEHGRAWSGLEGFAKRCRFRRGFVELATIWPSTFWRSANRIFEGAPLLVSISLEDETAENVRLALAHPAFARVRGLELPWVDDEALLAVAAQGAFAMLSTLVLRSLGPRGARELVASKQLRNLERFAIATSTLPDYALPSLFDTMPRLRALDLFHNRRPEQLVSAIPSTVRELVVAGTAIEALAASPTASQLERLMITVEKPGMLASLGAFTSLRSLDLHNERGTAPEIAGLALPPTLRELRCVDLTVDDARTICTTYGAQLELIELINFDPIVAADLQPLVAGDIYAHPFVGGWPPAFAGELSRAPMWDYPHVRWPPARTS